MSEKKSEKNEFGGYGSCGNFAYRTKEELSEFGKKGSAKANETRKRKRAMRETLEVFLSMPLKAGKEYNIEKIKNFASLKGKNITVNEALMIAQIQKALKGDTNALEFIRDMVGQKPVEKVDVSVEQSEKFVEIVEQIGGEGLEE